VLINGNIRYRSIPQQEKILGSICEEQEQLERIPPARLSLLYSRNHDSTNQVAIILHARDQFLMQLADNNILNSLPGVGLGGHIQAKLHLLP